MFKSSRIVSEGKCFSEKEEKEANRNMFLTEKEEKEGCFSPRKKKKKNASQKEANRKISGEFDDKDTSDSECKARMTQITSSIFNFQFAIFPRCR